MWDVNNRKAKVEAYNNSLRNFRLKNHIIDDIFKILQTEEDYATAKKEFNKLRIEWKEIGQIPTNKVNYIETIYNLLEYAFGELVGIPSKHRIDQFRYKVDSKFKNYEINNVEYEKLLKRLNYEIEKRIEAVPESNNIIENWVDNKRYTGKYNKLVQIVSDINSNQIAFHNILKKQNLPFNNLEYNSGIDIFGLNDCFLYFKLDAKGYEFYNNRIKEFGVISFDSETLEDDGYVRITPNAFIIFNKIQKDTDDRALFTGIAEFYHDYSLYIGSIVNNVKLGFGLFTYELEMEIDQEESDMDSYYRENTTKIFYCGYWQNDKKHGMGLLSCYNGNYKYKDYILIGKWDNNRLIEIYKKNDEAWDIIEQLINFMRIRKTKEYSYTSTVKVGKASNVTIDEINELFDVDYFSLSFPMIE